MRTKQKHVIEFTPATSFEQEEVNAWGKEIQFLSRGEIPQPDLIILNKLMYFLYERENIRIKKEVMKIIPPWTEDGILGKYRFTQVDRRLDAGTRYLMKKVLALSEIKNDAELLQRIIVYRLFNREETWEEIMACSNGGRWRTERQREKIINHLTKRKAEGFSVFTDAHLTWPGYYKEAEKRDVISFYWVKVIPQLFNKISEWLEGIQQEKSLELFYYDLVDSYGIGPFLAKEIMYDTSYTPLLHKAKDKKTFCAFGPGSTSYLEVLFQGFKTSSVDNKVALTQFLLDKINKKSALTTRVLDLSDLEHSFCETKKLIALRAGKSRARAYPFHLWGV